MQKEVKGGKPSVKKEDMQGIQTPQIFAVKKDCDSCDSVESRVQKFDPMMGLASVQMGPEQVHGIYFEEKGAMAEAKKLHKMWEDEQKMLEEKRGRTVKGLMKKIEELERERTKHFRSKMYDDEATVATKIQEYKDKIKLVEKAKRIKKKKLDETDSKDKESAKSFKGELEAFAEKLKLPVTIENASAKKAVLIYDKGEQLSYEDLKKLETRYKVFPHPPEPENDETGYRYTIEAMPEKPKK